VLTTQTNPGSFIDIYNSRELTGAFAGIFATTLLANDSSISIVNAGAIDIDQIGITAQSVYGTNSPVAIENSADIVARGGIAIQGLSGGPDRGVTITNSGTLRALIPDDCPCHRHCDHWRQ
jgi:hypothetical protein